MNVETPLGELAQAISEGLARPRHAWQALVIALALVGAAILARALAGVLGRRLRRGPEAAAQSEQGAAVATLRRLLFPFLGLLLLWAGEAVLRAERVLLTAADARLLRLAASLFGTLAVVRLLFAVLRRVLQSSALIARLERSIGAVATAGVALYATGVLDDVLAWLAATKIPLGSATQVSLWSVLVGSATTLGALLAAMWLGTLIEDRLDAESGLDPNLRTVLGRVARALLLVVAMLAALAVSGIDLTILSVFGGALGVGLGLGLQRIASNYVSGFILLLDRSLRIGDMVAVDKYYGQVTQISTRYTVLRSGDGTEAIVPNEMFVSQPVVNSTLSSRRVVLAVQVMIGPRADVGLALQLMREAAQGQPRVLADPAPVALLTEFRAGNLVLDLNFSITDPENGRQNVQSDVSIALLERFRANHIELAAPRGDFQVAEQERSAGAGAGGPRPSGPLGEPSA